MGVAARERRERRKLLRRCVGEEFGGDSFQRVGSSGTNVFVRVFRSFNMAFMAGATKGASLDLALSVASGAEWWGPLCVKRHESAVKAMLGRGLELSQLRRFVAGADVFSRQADGTTIAKQYLREGIKLRPANTDRVNG